MAAVERGKATSSSTTGARKRASAAGGRNGAGPNGAGKADGTAPADVSRAELEQLLVALNAARDGDFRLRLPVRGKDCSVDADACGTA